jgi:hypothetical protein
MSRIAVAALALLGMLAALGGPLIAFALDSAPDAPFCGRDGRCCCEHGPAPDPGVPCVRSRCGCDRPDAATLVLPLRQPAVVAGATALFAPLAVGLLPLVVASLPLSPVFPPLLPPPRVAVVA